MTDRYMTPQEIAREKREAEAREEFLQRKLLADTNRDEGRPEPKSGDKLVVATAKGLNIRGRAGLAFNQKPTEVKVDDVSDEEIVARQKTGEYVVNLHGAEQIIADSNGDESLGQHRGLFIFNSMGDAQSQNLEEASSEALRAALAKAEEREAANEARRKAKRENPDRITSTNKATREKGSAKGDPGDGDGEGEKTPVDPKSTHNTTTKPPIEKPKS